jgi:tripartite ATP-independent transporter DctP family solute receptor
MTRSSHLTRRDLLARSAALPLFSIVTLRADAAEFELKYATGQDPTHPVNLRAKEALDRIREATSGRVSIKLFPANQLGSDTDLLAQVRNGSVEFFNLSSLILSTFVPASGITSAGFAFKGYDDVWKAMDGELGAYIRAEIAKTPIFTVSKAWDNGFRHITSSTREIKAPADLKGFKVRVPPAPPLTSLFNALEAAPSPINFNEVYTALQTKVVEGQENPLAIIATARLYEVQKSCSLTGHVWDGYWVLGNKRAFQKLPADIQQIITREIDKSATDRAGRHRQAQQQPQGGSQVQGDQLRRRAAGRLPQEAGRHELLQRVEDEVRRAGLGAAREGLRQARLKDSP